MAEQTAPSSVLDRVEVKSTPLVHLSWGVLFTLFLCIWPKSEVKPDVVGRISPSAGPLPSRRLQEVLFQLDSSATGEKAQQVCGVVRRGKTNLG